MFGPGESSTIIECSGDITCHTLHAILTSGLLFFVLLTAFAYTTVLERRFLGSLQSRIGPNRAGPWGLLQPVADGIKLIFKEDVTPSSAEKVIFWLAPMIKVIPVLLVVAVIPLGPRITIPWFDGKWYRMDQGLIDVNVGVLWLLAITSIGIYGVVLAGWSSNNKYAMLGGLRSSAQMVSYELSMGLAVVVPVMLSGSMSITDIIEKQNATPILGWFVFQNPLAAVVLFVALLAEVNRSPFDMPEAEQELTAGYHSEYSGMKFALFFMAEYIGMVAVSMIGAGLYLGGYHFIGIEKAPLLGPVVYSAKVFLLLLGMIWVRATLPRIRYDRLMAFGWKVMLPLALVAVAWTAVTVIVADELDEQSVNVVGSVVLLVLTLGGLAVWLSRIGRKPEQASVHRVEVVTLGGQGVGAPALHTLDRLFGWPMSIVNLLARRRLQQQDSDTHRDNAD
ncbi:MAG: NADH-quinone oxidoreductase subunit NuoH [Anaerolineae bacterium]|nr:NADH-quinone oxidoreductase subunit NuoH [Anaerolineae bacterium]